MRVFILGDNINSEAENFWQNEGNRKRFFEKYASEKGFDPLQAEQWYKVLRYSILTRKVTPLSLICSHFII